MSEDKIIHEPFASEIRRKLIRYRKGELTKEEIEYEQHIKDISKKYNAIWKDVANS